MELWFYLLIGFAVFAMFFLIKERFFRLFLLVPLLNKF
jgi:hypothetical protein